MALTFTGGVKLQQGSFKATITPLPPSYSHAVHFDGTNDWLSRGGGLTGAVDGKQATISVWFKVDSDGTTISPFYTEVAAGGRNYLRREASNKLAFHLVKTSGSSAWNVITNRTILTTDNWVHVIISINSATGSRYVYINDTIDTLATDTFVSNEIYDFTQDDWAVGGFTLGSLLFDGDMAEMYFTNEFIDISIESNRRKFITIAGKPEDLGADGSTPTGTAPLMYFSGNIASWATNKGTGGGFTENGALTTALTSPYD